ncbi:Hypothetical predicted protein [Cloeon dipterum]|uniref:Uncharacterized protein n=1 Tax=Cloeon dipterum TaxID=197152 RepID=A0A8S1D8X4_9INSE|nr:Hypothetical predicted protein [Cloeon dipterum]
MQILRSSATPWVMGTRRRAGWAGAAMQCRHRFHIPCEKSDAVLDGQAPPCRFSGAERRRAGWAGAAMQILRRRATPWVMGRRRRAGWPGTAMQILRSRATPCWMGRRRHANSPEQSDAVGDGQAPPCRFSGAGRRCAGWAGVTMQILRSSATPWVMGTRRHADSPEQSDAMGGWLARIAVSWEESDTVFDGLAPKFRGMPVTSYNHCFFL